MNAHALTMGLSLPLSAPYPQDHVPFPHEERRQSPDRYCAPIIWSSGHFRGLTWKRKCSKCRQPCDEAKSCTGAIQRHPLRCEFRVHNDFRAIIGMLKISIKETTCRFPYDGATNSTAGARSLREFSNPTLVLNKCVRGCVPHAARWLARQPRSAISAART